MEFRRFIVLTVLFLAAGCSYLRLQYSPRKLPNDWNMYGGNACRTNNAAEALRPPLALQWVYDGSAGFCAAPAVVVDSLLVVGNLQGEIQVLRVRDGKNIGSHDFGSAIAGCPIIDGDAMIVPLAHDEESLVSYQLSNGLINWKAKLGDIESSPLEIGSSLFVATVGGKLVCLNVLTGAVTWTYELARTAPTRSIHSSPASDGETIFIGTDAGELLALGMADGKLRWHVKTRGSIVASPSVAGGRVFVGSLDSSFYALDVRTGEKLWERPLGAQIYSSAAVDSGAVYVGTVGRKMTSIRKNDGSLLWTISVNGVLNSPPLISGEVLYFGSLDKTITAVDIHNGNTLWQYAVDGRIKTMPIVWGKYLFVFAEDHSVFAFSGGEQ